MKLTTFVLTSLSFANIPDSLVILKNFILSSEINMIQFSASMSSRLVSTYLTGNIINILNISNTGEEDVK